MHNEMFGLFEAMSAIEMMDPKMDAGMCCNKNTEPPLTFDTAVSVSILFCHYSYGNISKLYFPI